MWWGCCVVWQCEVLYQCVMSVSMSAVVNALYGGCVLKASLISAQKFSQFALAKSGLGGAAMKMGWVEIVSCIGIGT